MDLGGAERFTLNLAKYFSKIFASVTVASTGGIYEEELKKFNIGHYKINVDPKIKNLLPLSRELNSFIKSTNFDIIHTHHRIVQFALQIVPGKYFKNIYTSHNYFNDLYQKMMFPDMAVAISPFIKDNLIMTSLINRNKIRTVNLGTEIPDFNDYNKNDPFITFGFTGRLIEEKGIYILLDSAVKLFNEGYKFKVVFRGKGEETNLKSRIKELNLEHIVKLVPPSNNTDEIYSDFNVFVLPTKFNEGLPLSILEAAARKKLIIAGNAGAISDFVINNETGILLDEINSESLYKVMKDIITGDISRSTLTENAFSKLRAEYSLDKTCLKYSELYLELLK